MPRPKKIAQPRPSKVAELMAKKNTAKDDEDDFYEMDAIETEIIKPVKPTEQSAEQPKQVEQPKPIEQPKQTEAPKQVEQPKQIGSVNAEGVERLEVKELLKQIHDMVKEIKEERLKNLRLREENNRLKDLERENRKRAKELAKAEEKKRQADEREYIAKLIVASKEQAEQLAQQKINKVAQVAKINLSNKRAAVWGSFTPAS